MGSTEPDDFTRLEIVGDGKSRTNLLERFAEDLNRLNWPSSDVFGIQMAVEESVSNAYRHGNDDGQRGNVSLAWRISEHEFVLEVRDHGDGFDETKVSDPRDPENLESMTGRGLLLIRNFMDDVTYRDGGRTVTMLKKRSDSEAN